MDSAAIRMVPERTRALVIPARLRVLEKGPVHLTWMVLLASLSLGPSEAGAGGFTIPVIGSRGAGIGGFVARADDTSAMYHNPAGLGMLGSYMVDISGTGVLSHTVYSRCTEATFDASGQPTGCTVGPDGEPLMEPAITTVPYGGLPQGFGILPYLGLAGRFTLKHVVFGLALYSPHNATGSFPDCTRDEHGAPQDCDLAPNRFHAVLGTINTIFIQPSVAVTPHPDLHLGLGVALVRATLTSERSLWVGGDDSLLGTEQFWNGEGRIRLDTSAYTWAFALGTIWHAGRTLAPGNRWLRGLRLGAAFTGPASITFSTDLQLFSPLLYSLMEANEGCRKGDKNTSEVLCAINMDFTFPMQFRFGFNWSITPEWGLGFDATWQDYSVYSELRLSFEQPLVLPLGSKRVTVEENIEPKDSKDCWTLSGGVQYAPAFAPGLEIRLGLIWDQSPYPDSTYSLLSPDADKMGPSISLSYQFAFGLEISAGYIPMFYNDREVRDSVLRPRICKPDDDACRSLAPDADFSMNGDVKDKRVDLFTLQLGWRFGQVRPGLPY